MAKFCSNCGKELEDNVSFCLNCGVMVGNTHTDNNNKTKKEKKKGLPTWAIVLIVVGCFTILPLILVTIIAVTAFSVIGDSGFESFIEESIVQRGSIGDTLRTEQLKITLTEVLKYDSIGNDEYFVEKPAEGKEFLVFFFNVENISYESQYIYHYDFSGYVDGYSTSVKHIYNNIDDIENLAVDLAPGMKAKGFIVFEVHKTWQEFEIHFNDMFEYEDEIIFSVINETNSSITGA